MRNKLQDCLQLEKETIGRVTSGTETWTAFLKVMARNYKYAYSDQLMIFAQRPDATACAGFEIWKNKVKRYVMRGKKGIALIDRSGPKTRLRYVFDVSDTGEGRNSRPVRLWQMRGEYRELIGEAFRESFTGLEEGLSLERMIREVAEHLSARYWDANEAQLLAAVRGSQAAGQGPVAGAFRKVTAASVTYCVYSRCPGDPEVGFEQKELAGISTFNTPRAVNALGKAVSAISARIFRMIAAVTEAYEESLSERLEVESETKDRTNDLRAEPAGKEGSNGKRDVRGQAGIQGGWRLPDPEPQAVGGRHGAGREQLPGRDHPTAGAGTEPREVRQDAQGVSGGEQTHNDDRYAPDGRILPAFDRDRQGGGRESESDHGAAFEGIPTSGQSDRPDGVGPAHERLKGTGGGVRDRGTDHQLSFLDLQFQNGEEDEGALPAGESTAKIESLTTESSKEAESQKPSAFSMPEEEKDAAVRWLPYSDGRLRIYESFARAGDRKSRIAFLKSIYGYCGCSWSFLDGSSGSLLVDGKGFRVYHKPSDTAVMIRWPQAERRIDQMIREDRYLSADEKERIEDEKLSLEVLPRMDTSMEEPAMEVSAMDEPAMKESAMEESAVDDSAVEKTAMEGFATEGTVMEGLTVEEFAIEESAVEESAMEEPVMEESTLDKEAAEETLNDTVDVFGDEFSTAEEAAAKKGPKTESSSEELTESNPLQEEHPISLAANYRITDEHLGEGGPKEKFARNIAAIETLFALEKEGKDATPAEQGTLSKYVGWGGLSEAFDPENSSWKKEYEKLKDLLPKKEYELARASTLNAHFTSPAVIRAIYEALGRMGFVSGNILEPSMGIGNFFGMLPEEMRGSRLFGVELDSISGRIAKKLYPEAEITVAGFETTDRRDFYDIAVGNVPFGNYKVSDKPYDRLGFSIHNYFFAKSLDQIRPGGIIAFVTSRYTMDQKSPDVRRYLAQRAELLGAIRLPNNAFSANAGTRVVSDILFLQKRELLIDVEPDWVHLGLTEEGFAVNSYFVEHPEMVLGRLETESTQYGREDVTVSPIPGSDLAEELSRAVRNIHGAYTPAVLDEKAETFADPDILPADPTVGNYSFAVVSGRVFFRENSVMRPVELSDAEAGRVKGMVRLRGIVNELIRFQMDGYPEEAITGKQRELSEAYDSFTSAYGTINSRQNTRVFDRDSSYYLLCSLEVLDEDGNMVRKADIFTKRTIRPERKVTHVDEAGEALAVSIGEKGRVDLPFMAELLGRKGEIREVAEMLRGSIYKDPAYADGAFEEGWLAADEYLSGNVRRKLQAAREAAAKDPFFVENAAALERALPKDLDASEIDVRLGATWLGKDVIQDFMYETFNTPRRLRRGYYAFVSEKNTIYVQYEPSTAEWWINGKGYAGAGDVPSCVTYGTKWANAYRILEDTLNLKDVRIYDKVQDENGNERRVLNREQTALAQQKQQAIRDVFQEWVFKESKRREMLVRRYNDLFNSTRPREYDGSNIRFVGMNPDIQLRGHQRAAVARILYGRNTLLAHEVGLGKTFVMVASAMESKRLGLSRKALFVVPNHLTLQWAGEFLRLYPGANILVARKKDFETANRKKFCARIATGDYDAVIIGHSQFEKIPISAERQARLLEGQIADITEAIANLKERNGERFSIKQMEKTKKSLEARLVKLSDQGRKDDVITFEQLGVDKLFVDESHAFKNLFLYTKMRNIAGISTTEAQKSSDMFMKCRYLDEVTGGKGIVFATATPTSNSMTELYTVMRYLQYDTLQEMGLSHFDCWASTFGETTTAIELAPEGTGYRARTRFSKFFNLPELMNLFKEAADVKTSDQLNLPVPKAVYENIVVQPSGIQKEMVEALSVRASRIHQRAVDPSEDNMLKITSDGRKIGLDQRLMNPLLPDHPGSKLNACVEKVLMHYEAGREKRLTQLIFCDSSTPKKDGTINVYDDVRKKLVAGGIPEEEVAFIHDADTETKKKTLFGKVRAGQVRVLMGSTQKMGAGTNVQDRLIAVHHLDVGWRPADMTQRNGRIIRQGNQNPEVMVYQYVTEGTFDAYLYQTLENKQRFIGQIMTSRSPVRSANDVDEQALSYAEVKALCAGNPLIREKMDLDVEVARLKLLKANWQSSRYMLEDKLLKRFPAELKRGEALIAGLTEDLRMLASHPLPEEGFIGMAVQGKMFNEAKEAGEALLALCKGYKGQDSVLQAGSYRGFRLEISFDVFHDQFEMTLRGSVPHRVALGNSAQGIITRMDNKLAHMEKELHTVKLSLTDLRHQQTAAEEEVKKPFAMEEELRTKSARLAELDAELNMDKPDMTIAECEDSFGAAQVSENEGTYETRTKRTAHRQRKGR